MIGLNNNLIKWDKKLIDCYFTNCIEYLCELLGADKNTIKIAPCNANIKGCYSKSFTISLHNMPLLPPIKPVKVNKHIINMHPVSKKSCVPKNRANLSYVNPYKYSKKIYLNYKKDNNDMVLKKTVDWLGQLIEEKFLPCDNEGFGYYDEPNHNFLSEYEFARKVHESVQNQILYYMSNVLGLDFENLISLSEMFYESQTSSGYIAFLPKSIKHKHECYNLELKSNEEIIFSNQNLKFIRKLLAGSSSMSNTLLFTQGDNGSYGYKGYVEKAKLPGKANSPCVVTFNGRSSLTVELNGKILFHIKNRKLTCNQDKLGIYIDSIYKMFKIPSKDEDCRKIITKISRQAHGTSIILSDNNCMKHFHDLFTNRRAMQTMYVNKDTWCKRDNTSLVEMTRVDGATVVSIDPSNPNGSTSIAFTNVIVDVTSTQKSNPAFGARHNAITSQLDMLAKNYPFATIAALIFSESGDITFLFPQTCNSSVGNIAKHSKPTSSPPSPPKAMCLSPAVSS